METPSATEERQRFGLAWGFGLSILVHLLLILLTQWFPLVSSSGDVPPDLDQSITFSFARPADPTTEDPREDAPFLPVEAEPLPEVLPTPQVEAPEAEPLPEPFEEASVPEVEQTQPTETVEEQPAATDFPEAGEGNAASEEPIDPSTPPEPQIDVMQALRNFQRAIARRPAPTNPLPQAEGVKENVISPDLSQIPYSGFGVGNLVFESRDYDWSDYGRQVYNAIWQAWHRRLWATTDEFEKWAHENTNWYLDHRTQIRFVIESNGQVTGIALEGGSGCGPLDASAIDALTEVILPPLPAGFPRDREIVHAGFIATGQIRVMRRSLGALRAAGFF